MAKRTMICSNCGAQGESKTRVKGSFWIELALWLLLLIPGVIYSIWRLTTKEQVCRTCESAALLPVDSPVGQRLIAEHHGEPSIPAPPPDDPPSRLPPPMP